MATDVSVDELNKLWEQPTYEHDKGYRLIFLDDDVTPFVYVMLLLMTVFEMDKKSAFTLTEMIHTGGRGEVFKGTWEECSDKKKIVDELNQAHNEHLFSIIEKIT